MAREETVVLDFEIDESDSVESINSITKASKALREKRSKLNLQSVEGQKRVKEINAELDKNNSKIKDNVSALEKQRINVGNYKSALDGVHPALGKVGQGLEAGTQGFKAMTLQALRFIATPIGAILAALVAVFSLLKTALSQNDALMDKFENITNAVSVVLEVLVSRVGKLGEAFLAFVTMDFDKAIDLTAQAFGGLADEIGNAVKQQQILLEETRNIEDAQRDLRVETAKSENAIKELIVASKNRSLTLDQQEEKLREALRLEQELVKQREDLALRELRTTAKQLRVAQEFQQKDSENFETYVNRLLDSGALGAAELNKLTDKVVALENARGSSLDFQAKVENNLSAIQEKRAIALEKQNKALEEQQALREANLRAAREEVRSSKDGIQRADRKDPLIDAFTDRANVITDINDRLQTDLTERQREAELERIQNAKKSAEMQVDVERAKVGIIGGLIGTAADLFEEQSVGQKVLASAQALINTYLAATAALASGSKINPVFGILSAAAAVAAGLASVAKINGVEFAEGGYTGPGDKYEVAGIVHKDEYVVNKSTRQRPEAQPHLMALERMRLGQYADGGLTTNSISTPINQQLEIVNIVKNMPAPVVGVKQFMKVAKQVQVKESISKR